MAKIQAVSTGGFDEEHERDFCDFISSIAVTPEELVAIVSMPDYSIPQVKQHLRKARLTGESVPAMAGPRTGNTPAPAGVAAASRQRLLTERSPVIARTLRGRRPPGKIFHLHGGVTAQAVPLPKRS